MIRKALLILSAVLIGIVCGLLASELLLRINPVLGYSCDSFKSRVNPSPFASGSVARYRPSDLLGYELIPNSHPDINSYGLIGREYKLAKDKGVYRILVIGDSIAEQGYGSVFLEARLNTDPLLSKRYVFQVWTLGTGSYDVRRYARFLEHRGLDYNPDMVITFLFMNDFELNMNIYYKAKNDVIEYCFPISEVSRTYNVNPFLMKHSHLYRFITLGLNKLFLLNERKAGDMLMKQESGADYLQKIKEICSQNQITLLLTIFPYLKPLSEYDEYRRGNYRCLNTAAGELGLDYINLYDGLSAYDLYSLREDINDDMHPNLKGHRIISGIIHDYILKKGLIK